MRKLPLILMLTALAFTQLGCDDLLEDFDLEIDFYGAPGGYYQEPYADEYWYETTYYEDTYYEDTYYEDTYYEDDWYYDVWDDWYFLPW